MGTKLTTKEKKKAKRIERKLTTKFCTEVNIFGYCACPHCGVLIIIAFDFEPKVGQHRCDICNKKFIIDEEIAKLVKERTEKLSKLLQKVTSLEYDKIDVIEAGIDRNCDINEVALLCKYFQCGIGELSGHVKKLLYKKSQGIPINVKI